MKNSVYGLILRLVSYGINTGLIEKEDIIYTQNRLLSLFNMDEPDDSCTCLTADNEDTLEEILSGLLDYAYEKGIIPENTVTYRDLFDVKLMASLVKRPSEVIREFWQNYSCSPKLATDSYYKFSCDTDYIRRYRIKKDLKWKTSTEYGEIMEHLTLLSTFQSLKKIRKLLQRQNFKNSRAIRNVCFVRKMKDMPEE